ncbi:DUF1648 domain-containing protein [Nocardioides abyssi]|uniref:DUF1648 domain-containing protein n=1 Tax=Nocardioides abyssi TaxID=3058370 RepID=A0ABT8ENY6_9ACTN|nr:DUF1648 domain-containing protein [Nocardioides abyssi]MDN4159868.1 DUF1648 domain-containing protein [Nocardioides abyssi]
MTARHTYLATLVCFGIVLVGSALAMPAEVPLHFGGSGEPDRWGSRLEALLTMTLVGGLLAVILGGTAALVDRMPVTYLNVPRKDWWTATPEREARMRRMMRTDLYVLAAATMLFLAVVVLATTLAARAEDPALGPLFFTGLGCYLAFVVGWTVWSLSTRYRRKDDA